MQGHEVFGPVKLARSLAPVPRWLSLLAFLAAPLLGPSHAQPPASRPLTRRLPDPPPPAPVGVLEAFVTNSRLTL
jgi:hypothetical protein